MPARPDQPWEESRLWRLLLPTLVAPVLAVAGAALAGMAYFTAAHAHPLPSTPETAGSSDSPRTADSGSQQARPATEPGPERFHNGFAEGSLVAPASSDPTEADTDMGPRKAGFGYGLRLDRDTLPETRTPTSIQIRAASPVSTAPPQPEFTPD